MNYNQAINYIQELNKKGMVFGLDNIKALLSKKDNPQNKLNIIHIAGTNGKGSVGTYLAHILDRAGYKVGRFYSPSLFHYGENICISHKGTFKCISEDEIAEYIEDLSCKGTFDGVSAFEMETAMALCYMADENCDVCLIECGLGGLEDATNIMDEKIMSIITSIGMDHMNILGNSIKDITLNKCGIIPGSKTVVTTSSNAEVLEIIEGKCQEYDIPLVVSSNSDVILKDRSITGLVYDDIKNGILGLKTVMPGIYQLENSYLAVNAAVTLNQLGFDIQQEHIKNGLLMARWYGRFDIVSKSPLVIADGAHNEAAAKVLKQSVDEYFEEYNKIYVMGVFKDKEYEKILSIMSGDGIIFAGKTDNERALDSDILTSVAKRYFNECVCADSIKEALDMAVKESTSKENTVIICFGSLSIMTDIYNYFKQNTIENRLDSIRNDFEFVENMKLINEFEKNRIFCGHDFNHLLDVARIAWIYCLENKINLDKELIYATALLHDIGRAKQYLCGENHEEAGCSIAKNVLNRAGFSQEEIKMIINAIMVHNRDWDKKSELGNVIALADKKSRQCYMCEAKQNCKWTWDSMNNSMEY